MCWAYKMIRESGDTVRMPGDFDAADVGQADVEQNNIGRSL